MTHRMNPHPGPRWPASRKPYFSIGGRVRADAGATVQPAVDGQCRMPILDVELVADAVPADAAQALADVASAVFGTPAGETWVRLRALAPGAYAESAGGARLQAMPVFVTVTRRQVPARPALVREIDALTHAIAGVLHRPPERIHIEYAPPAAGRIAFGGTLVE
jgi:phenylpyruvate tautomerase PptA (4-oxalocrotonate tautomerase family)